MIIWTPNIYKWSFVIFWYKPFVWWKFWPGYRPGIIGKTLYVGPLKIVTGPRT